MTYYVDKVINSTGVETQEQTIKRVRLRIVTNMHTDAGDDFSESCRSTEHFVLVHGAGHGAWCWFRLLRLLQDSGHRVSAVDLAGAAGSLVDPNHVRSFDDYNAPLLDLMASLPAGDKVGDSDYGSLFHQHLLLKVQLQINMFYVSGQPFNLMHSSLVCQVILIGHSAGGLSVVHAMHLFGDRIKQAIFIAATMLQFGYQTEQDIKDVIHLSTLQ